MSERFRDAMKQATVLLIACCLAGLAAQPLSGQVTIPQGSTITSATLSVYVYTPIPRVVNLHRITAEWAESVVTYNSFANSYDPVPFTSFVPNAVGWKDIDITGMFQAWYSGIYPNYGIALVEPVDGGSSIAGLYHSSEWYMSQAALRPKLVINYTPPGGMPTSVTIQRPGSEATQVLDTVINPQSPGMNYGMDLLLLTRFYGILNKYSLIRFIFTVPPPTCPGTGTPGYWMNHPEAWPEDNIIIGGISYDKFTAIELMKMSVSGDKTYTMFAALVAAKLNAALGCATICPDGTNISATITAADAWMFQYPIGSGVAAGGRNSPWRVGEPLYFLLDQYNNGYLCVPSRDIYEY